MRFLTLIRLPEAAHEKTQTPPTQLITDAIEREGGALLSLDGVTGGYDVCARYECQSPEAQFRIAMVWTRAGFATKTSTAIEAREIDAAWSNAVKHLVGASR